MARFMPDGWPIPAVNDYNRDYFTSGKITLQQCKACSTVQHPPDEVCYNCQAMEFQPKTTNGKGTIHSVEVVHNPPGPPMAERVPYAVVLVSLDEHPGIRIIGNVPGAADQTSLKIGQKVKAIFEEIRDDEADITIQLPQWEVV